MKYTPIIAILFAVGLLTAANPAQAIYIETPLVLECQDEAEVGDVTTIGIGPNQNNASAKDAWAGKTVQVRYSYDKNENAEGGPDEPTSNEGYTEGDIGEITLDDKARGTVTWTVPAELDDFNVHLFLEDAAGERVAFANLAIGNATPMMYAMSGPSGEEPELGEQDDTSADGESGEAAGFGIVGLIAALGAALVGATLRRRS